MRQDAKKHAGLSQTAPAAAVKTVVLQKQSLAKVTYLLRSKPAGRLVLLYRQLHQRLGVNYASNMRHFTLFIRIITKGFPLKKCLLIKMHCNNVEQRKGGIRDAENSEPMLSQKLCVYAYSIYTLAIHTVRRQIYARIIWRHHIAQVYYQLTFYCTLVLGFTSNSYITLLHHVREDSEGMAKTKNVFSRF